ncbi:uncharacterized protein LOC132715685 [Ruditapes philippinarum]|uniref:uncharacterized protein LOC132715685 n=1 Tax=Ruditapes philippinarum TaxID=129788 RepID=UPI00295BE4E9|nr:uncharacterized protein LOC132715685 [Ruditapes philippinarum]
MEDSDYADTCLEAILDKDVETFEQVLQDIQQNSTQQRRSKWVQHIPVLCTMCNNHIFLEKVRLQLGDVYNFESSACLGDRISVFEIAHFLDYRECIEILIKLYGEPSKNKSEETNLLRKDFYMFANILNIANLFSSYLQDSVSNIVIRYFRRLVENGLDIRVRGPRNTTLLHEAISKLCTFEIVNTLFSHGCDINSVDDNGRNALSLFLGQARFSKCMAHEIILILRRLLYQNPVTSIDGGVIINAIFYDRKKFPDDYDLSDDEFCTDTESARINEDESFEKEHPNEYLRLLPWLYKYGFHISQANRDLIESPNLFTQSIKYNLSLSSPRTLKSRARVVFRDAYPGQRLHEVMTAITLPPSIREYILMECLNIGL